MGEENRPGRKGGNDMTQKAHSSMWDMKTVAGDDVTGGVTVGRPKSQTAYKAQQGDGRILIT